jgi:hypothetical protein
LRRGHACAERLEAAKGIERWCSRGFALLHDCPQCMQLPLCSAGSHKARTKLNNRLQQGHCHSIEKRRYNNGSACCMQSAAVCSGRESFYFPLCALFRPLTLADYSGESMACWLFRDEALIYFLFSYSKITHKDKCIVFLVTHNWPEKAKPERYQWKKPEWNKAESIRQKEQARIFIYRIGLRQNTSTEQGRNFCQ